MSEIIDARNRIQRLTEELEAAKAEIERLKGGKDDKAAVKTGFKSAADDGDEAEDDPKKGKSRSAAKAVKRQKVAEKADKKAKGKKKGRRW